MHVPLRAEGLPTACPPEGLAIEIAAETRFHPATVRAHARRLGIQMRAPWPDRSEFDEAWLRHRYVDDNAKISDIAPEAGVDDSTVQKAIGRYGLTAQGRVVPACGLVDVGEPAQGVDDVLAVTVVGSLGIDAGRRSVDSCTHCAIWVSGRGLNASSGLTSRDSRAKEV